MKKTDRLATRFSKQYGVPREAVLELIREACKNTRARLDRMTAALSAIYDFVAGVDDPDADPAEVIDLAAERQREYLDESVCEVVQFHLADSMN